MKYLEDKRVRSFIFAGAILVAFAFVFIKYDNLMEFAGKAIDVFRPVMIGFFIAFALRKPLGMINRLYSARYEKYYNRKLERIKRNNHGVLPAQLPRKSRIAFKLALLSVYICCLLVIGLLVLIIVPQLVESISGFIENFDFYYTNIEEKMQTYYSKQNPAVIDWIETLDIENKIYGLVEYVPNILQKTFGVTASFFGGTVDVVLGVVLSAYILAEKEHIKDQGRRLGRRFCSPKIYNCLTKTMALVSDKFTDFISGQLTEAFILGMLCFIGMKIFGFDYAVLISTIIGVTNMIPIFGPIIGTIPCAFILLLTNPKDAIWFVVFIIVLQQIESNLIYPKVVGSSMGLPALWVSVAVIVGGGFKGVIGMIVAIPLMSVLYTILKEKTEETGDGGEDNG
ncbi:MAG: AI-2E family transporter [Oscillospiraceae bacterium]|nr:AI-2E family transporter [Oscillospiraceae bacterium]